MIGYLLTGRVPGQLVIQYTTFCNAACPQCGMNITNTFPRRKLPTDAIRRIIDAAVQRGVKAVSFTGGEPLLFLDELTELIRYAGEAGIEHIRTGTNGFLFAPGSEQELDRKLKRVAEKLAATPLSTFWISIDSSSLETHEKMRGIPGVISGIERAVPVLHDHGLYPSANLGINRLVGGIPPALPTAEAFSEHYTRAFGAFYERVISLGFTIANACYPMSINDTEGLSAAYQATSPDEIVSFSSPEKALLYSALLEVIPRYRSEIRIFSPLSSLHSLIQQHSSGEGHSYPCLGGREFFFIDASGETFPCGYRGSESLGPFLDRPVASPVDGCRKCDWECFRDPSELMGPFQDMLKRPFTLAKRWMRDPESMRLWLRDLSYFRACGFFDGRKPPDYSRLARFRSLC